MHVPGIKFTKVYQMKNYENSIYVICLKGLFVLRRFLRHVCAKNQTLVYNE